MIAGPVVYVATNLINGKNYVGQTIDLRRRLLCHRHCKARYHFDHAIKKYGLESFRIIEMPCKREELNHWERFFIRMLGTSHPEGYNHTTGGDAKFEVSEEARRKLHDSMLGPKNHFYGRKHSAETRRKISEHHANFSGERHPQYGKGHKMPQWYREKRREMMAGERNSFFGKHHSPETKEKLRIQHLGRPLSEEHRRRIGEGLRRYRATLKETQ